MGLQLRGACARLKQVTIDQAFETEDGVTVPPEQNVREIGRALFSTRYVFAFEITAILLTVAVVGAVVLARRPRGEPFAVRHFHSARANLTSVTNPGEIGLSVARDRLIYSLLEVRGNIWMLEPGKDAGFEEF